MERDREKDLLRLRLKREERIWDTLINVHTARRIL
jgi:hypothetical protein